MIDLSLFKRQLSQHLKTDSRAYEVLHALLDAGTEKSPNLGPGPSMWSCRDSGSSHVVSLLVAIQTEEEWAITAGRVWWARLWRGALTPTHMPLTGHAQPQRRLGDIKTLRTQEEWGGAQSLDPGPPLFLGIISLHFCSNNNKNVCHFLGKPLSLLSLHPYTDYYTS